MILAFLLISFGYLTIVPQYSFPHDQGVILDNVGDVMRLFGLLVLLSAVLTG